MSAAMSQGSHSSILPPFQSAPHHNRVRWLQLLGGAAITSYISYAFSIHIRQFFITCHCAADTSPSSAFTLKYRKSIKRSQITAVCKQNISGTPNSRIHSAHRQPGQNHLNTARRIASPGVEWYDSTQLGECIKSNFKKFYPSDNFKRGKN